MRARAGPRSGTLSAVLLAAVFTVAPIASSAGDPFVDLQLIRPQPSKAAADFTVPRLGSGEIRLQDLRGRVVLLNFWATWCPPCKEEMPSMEHLSRRYRERGLTIVAVSVDGGDVDDVAAFAKKLGLTFPIGLDSARAVAKRYGVRAVPTTVVIDRNGQTVAVALGPRDWDGFVAHDVILSLLQ